MEKLPESNHILKENTDLLTSTTDTFVSPKSGHVLLKLFFHSILMFSLPFCTYYGIKSYVEREYDMLSPKSYIYGVIGAVIVVQLIIASYVYQAFTEEERTIEQSKKRS